MFEFVHAEQERSLQTSLHDLPSVLRLYPGEQVIQVDSERQTEQELMLHKEEHALLLKLYPGLQILHEVLV